jgi:hypothetical protein
MDYAAMADDYIKSEKEYAALEAEFREWKRREIDREVRICIEKIQQISAYTFEDYRRQELLSGT